MLNLVMRRRRQHHPLRNWSMKIKHVVLSVFFVITLQALGQEQVSLEKVIALALEENYDVQLSKNASASATAIDETAWAAFAPTINGTASTLWSKNYQEVRFSAENSDKDRS